MSNDSDNPPKGGRPPDKPGLVSRNPRGIFDAIPTEAEGDALFDELFGAFEDEVGDIEEEEESSSEGDRPTHEALDPAAFDEPFTEEPVTADEVADEETARPPDSVEPRPRSFAQRISEAERRFDVAKRPELDDAAELPVPEDEDPEATAFYDRDKVPYAIPYDVPPVEEESEPPGVAETKPGPSVIPAPPPRRKTYQQGIDEAPLEGLGDPAPSHEEIRIPRPPLTGTEDDALGDVAAAELSVGDVDLDEDLLDEDLLDDEQPLEMEEPLEIEDGRGRVDSIVPEVVSERPPEGQRLSIDDLAELGQPEEDVAVAVEDGIAFDEGEGLDAVVSLMQQEQREAWVERATWLYEEAPPPAQARERARALMVVSELFAMAGEDEQAEGAAREALELAPNMPMAHRQLRGMLMARQRWTEAVDGFDDEARVAATGALKAHASYLGAEIARLALGDPDGFHRRLDQADRALTDDPRVALSRLMESLAADDQPPAESHVAFREALDVIVALRSDGGTGEGGDTPHAILLRARNALRRREMTRVVAGLRVLEQEPSFGAGAGWLVATLGAVEPGLRGEALEALERVAEGTHGVLAQRARMARALEMRDDALSARLASELDEEILSPAERVTIALIAGQPDRAGQWLEAVEGELPSLALAARALESPSASVAALDDPSALALGRLLAAEATEASETAGFGPAVIARAEALRESDESHGAARAVLIEHAHATGQPERLAELLTADAVGHDQAMVAALLSELAGDRARMAECLESALADAPGDLAATRMSMTVGDIVSAASSLVRYADVAPDPMSTAIALTEAGLRLMEEEGQEGGGESLLRRASEQYPELPVAPFIGMYIAQALEDAGGEQFWLEQRKAIADDPADYVPDLIRRAMSLGEGQEAERSSLLEEAHRARPADYGLRDLYERAVGVATDRAAWLMERVEQGGADAKTAALEAALAAELDGDVPQAAVSVQKALALGDDGLAPVFAERHARLGHEPESAIARLEAAAEADGEPERRAERWARIAGIEAPRDPERALEALRSALAERPDHLPTLHAISSLSRRTGITDGLGGVALAIARQVDGPDGAAHAALSARLHLTSGKWEDTYEAVKLALAAQPSVWALRQMEAHARARGDHERVASSDRALADLTKNERDRATLFLRAAEATLALGDEEAAAELLREVLDRLPHHPVAMLERAAQLERIAEPPDAAQAWEELASICQSTRERAAKLYKAATLWLGLEGTAGRSEGRRLLEAVSQIDATHADTFERLQAIYLAEGAKKELAGLLAARLEQVDDPAERVELEVLRGRMLVEAGEAGEARDALRAALEASPDNAEALSAYADVCAAEEDWQGVEQAIIRLGRLVSDPEEQVSIHMRLGDLYAKHLPNPDRAEAAYESVLGKKPEHIEARRRLVSLYLERGDTAKAFEQQEQVIAAAKTPSAQCEATVRLAEVHAAAGDTKQAEQILMKARRQWNKEPSPVSALYRFYRGSGQEQAAEMLLERAAADVRRGLAAGRFEAPLFAMAQMVAEMRGQNDTAYIAQATLAAIRGRAAYVEGVGPRAGDPALDDDIAPELFTPNTRQLLRRTGAIMDAAVPFDLGSLRARPVTPDQGNVLEETQELAAAYGIPDVQVYTTNALGRVCVPAQSSPPTLCFGLALVTAEEEAVRSYLIHRALKILQTGTAALSRTAPIDLWPLFAAYLKVHSPSFTPQGVDAQKVAAFHARMMEIGVAADPQLSLVASDVIGSIGNRASSLSSAANAWGSRAALLAMGDPSVALTAIAWAAGAPSGPPESGPERLRWIGRQAEARDLVVFSVSDGYANARARLGVQPPVTLEGEDLVALDEDDLLDVDLE